MNVTAYICGVLDAKGNRTASTMYRITDGSRAVKKEWRKEH